MKWNLEIELSINDNTKSPQMYKRIVEITDSTHIVYWRTNIAKKADK